MWQHIVAIGIVTVTVVLALVRTLRRARRRTGFGCAGCAAGANVSPSKSALIPAAALQRVSDEGQPR